VVTNSDFGLAPVLLGDEEYVEIKAPSAPADVGEQEIDGVERETG